MTMVHERTRSVVESGEFLAALAKDNSLPELIRNQAKQLLRHYPSAQEIWTAGRYENLRQQEIVRLIGTSMSLPPALALWPLCAPFFCDANEQDGPMRRTQLNTALDDQIDVSEATSISSWALPKSEQTLVPATTFKSGCLSLRYLCFTSLQEQILVQASRVLGSRLLALQWLNKAALGLDKRPPCSLLSSYQDYKLVADFLTRIEYGVY